MQLAIEADWLFAVYLISLRLGVVLMFAPMFVGLQGFVTVRVLLTLACALVLADGAPRPVLTFGLGAIVASSAAELVVGGVMAFGVLAAFAVFSVAGKILEIQSGFGIGGVYDPVTNAPSPVFGTLLNLTAVAVFFAMQGHHALLRGMAYSFERIAPGSGFAQLPGEAMIAQFGVVFSLGVAFLIPVVACLLLIEFGLAIVSRMLPQMNVIIVLVPIKIAAALILFALTVPFAQGSMARVFRSLFEYWERILG